LLMSKRRMSRKRRRSHHRISVNVDGVITILGAVRTYVLVMVVVVDVFVGN
jgi:hypothetical protein